MLGPLLAHDQRRGTDLVGTLAAWFAAGRSPTRAASALHVHVNTVTQRLDRVRAVLGPDWQEPERTLELHLALRLQGLAHRGTDDGTRPVRATTEVDSSPV